jgi:hypothetical protein
MVIEDHHLTLFDEVVERHIPGRMKVELGGGGKGSFDH